MYIWRMLIKIIYAIKIISKFFVLSLASQIKFNEIPCLFQNRKFGTRGYFFASRLDRVRAQYDAQYIR